MNLGPQRKKYFSNGLTSATHTCFEMVHTVGEQIGKSVSDPVLDGLSVTLRPLFITYDSLEKPLSRLSNCNCLRLSVGPYQQISNISRNLSSSLPWKSSSRTRPGACSIFRRVDLISSHSEFCQRPNLGGSTPTTDEGPGTPVRCRWKMRRTQDDDLRW